MVRGGGGWWWVVGGGGVISPPIGLGPSHVPRPIFINSCGWIISSLHETFSCSFHFSHSNDVIHPQL